MQKLKVNHSPRDVKVLTDQLVDAVRSGNVAPSIGVVTLEVGSTFTTVFDPKVNANSVVLLTPQHANAEGLAYWLSYGSGVFTIHHADTASADSTFGYVVLGG